MSSDGPPPTSIRSNEFDAYSPAEVARRVESAGVSKASMPALQTITLAVLAGAFIGFGGALYTVAVTGAELGFGPTRILGGVAFSLGLILVVVAGAELFTGNNLIVMAWADGRVSTARIARNWVLVFLGNAAGAVALAVLVSASGIYGLSNGAVGETAQRIAEAKVVLGFQEAFWRGVLCNMLVCLAVWMCFAAHTVPGKAVAIIFPVAGFVALGFEHSIANLYLIPVGYLAGAGHMTIGQMLGNLVPVTLGNIVGGSLLVAAVYWIVYIRGARN